MAAVFWIAASPRRASIPDTKQPPPCAKVIHFPLSFYLHPSLNLLTSMYTVWSLQLTRASFFSGWYNLHHMTGLVDTFRHSKLAQSSACDVPVDNPNDCRAANPFGHYSCCLETIYLRADWPLAPLRAFCPPDLPCPPLFVWPLPVKICWLLVPVRHGLIYFLSP